MQPPPAASTATFAVPDIPCPRATSPARAPAVDLVGQRLDVYVEALLHLVEHLAVRLGGHKGDGQALGAKAAGAADLRVFRSHSAKMLVWFVFQNSHKVTYECTCMRT